MLSLLSSMEEGEDDEDDDPPEDQNEVVYYPHEDFQHHDAVQMVWMLDRFLSKFVMTNNHCLVAVREKGSLSSVVSLFANNHYLVAEKEEDSSSFHENFSLKDINLSCPETENKMVKKLHSEFSHAGKPLLAVKNVSSNSFVLAKFLVMLSSEYGATPVAFFTLMKLLSHEGGLHAAKSTPTRSGSDMLDTKKRDDMSSYGNPCLFVHHVVANVKAFMLVGFSFLGKFVFPQCLFSSKIPPVMRDATLNDDYGRRSWSFFSTSPALCGSSGTASWNKDAELHDHYPMVHARMWKGPSVHVARIVFANQDTQHMSQGNVRLHIYMPRNLEFAVERSFCLLPFIVCLYPDIVLFMEYPPDINTLCFSRHGKDDSLFSFAAIFRGKGDLHAPLASKNGLLMDVGMFSPLVRQNMAISCQSPSLDIVKHSPLLHATFPIMELSFSDGLKLHTALSSMHGHQQRSFPFLLYLVGISCSSTYGLVVHAWRSMPCVLCTFIPFAVAGHFQGTTAPMHADNQGTTVPQALRTNINNVGYCPTDRNIIADIQGATVPIHAKKDNGTDFPFIGGVRRPSHVPQAPTGAQFVPMLWQTRLSFSEQEGHVLHDMAGVSYRLLSSSWSIHRTSTQCTSPCMEKMRLCSTLQRFLGEKLNPLHFLRLMSQTAGDINCTLSRFAADLEGKRRNHVHTCFLSFQVETKGYVLFCP